MRKERLLAIAATLALALSACGGGGSGGGSIAGGGSGGAFVPTPSPTPSSAPAAQLQSESVAAANAAGAPIGDISQFEDSIDNPIIAISSGEKRSATDTPTPGATTSPHPSPTVPPTPSPTPTPYPYGTCITNSFGGGPTGTTYPGIIAWNPDRAGDPGSVEYAFYYDSGCTQIARDMVRIVTSTTGTGSATTQTSTVTNSYYDRGNPNPTSIATESNRITGVLTNGYPTRTAGYSRSSQWSSSVAGSIVSQHSSEYVMQPSSGTSSSFCGDSAGFNPATLASTAEVDGWSNVMASSTRTVNADGSVTYANSSSGAVYRAVPPAALGIATAAFNNACPITTPAFSLTGGSLVSSYAIPSMSITFKGGLILNLTIVNATLSNGYTLDVATTAGASPTSHSFITGSISKNGSPVATFSVDARGDGTLTVVSSGAVYNMVHWHVSTDKSTPAPSPSAHPSESPHPSASPSTSPSHSPSPTPTGTH